MTSALRRTTTGAAESRLSVTTADRNVDGGRTSMYAGSSAALALLQKLIERCGLLLPALFGFSSDQRIGFSAALNLSLIHI